MRTFYHISTNSTRSTSWAREVSLLSCSFLAHFLAHPHLAHYVHYATVVTLDDSDGVDDAVFDSLHMHTS